MLVDVELIRRGADRFIARALLFPDLVVEAESREAALASLRAAWQARRRAGVEIVRLVLDDEGSTVNLTWPTHAGAFPDDELFQEMLAAVERERHTPDPATG